MSWKLKAFIQNTVAWFPSSLNYNIYYWIQRNIGNLRTVNPIHGFIAGVRMCETIIKFNRILEGKIVFEVGTGRRINIPLVFWLVGIERIITVDSNKYLKKELIKKDINYIKENQNEIRDLFKNLNLNNDRFQKLIELSKTSWTINDLLQLCNIEYTAPGDAANVAIANDFIDFHVSYTVFEHIPLNGLSSILHEGNRIIKKNGLFIHAIDLSDHFSYSDKSITSVNMLRFNDKEWNRYVKNNYMYINRLRIDDFINLFQSLKQNILLIESITDKKIHDLLKKNSLIINKKFKDKSKDVLSTTSSWIISEKM